MKVTDLYLRTKPRSGFHAASGLGRVGLYLGTAALGTVRRAQRG